MVLAVFFLVLLVLTGWSIRLAAERLRDYFAIAFCTVALLPLLMTTITGDMSRYFPGGTFASGFEGKDQIVIVSAATTLLLAMLLAALLVRAMKSLWRKFCIDDSAEPR